MTEIEQMNELFKKGLDTDDSIIFVITYGFGTTRILSRSDFTIEGN